MSIRYKILSLHKKKIFPVNSKLNVLIEISDIFTESDWQVYLKKYNDKYNFLFYSDKYSAYKNIIYTDYMFAFGINAYYDYSNIKKYYLGLSECDGENVTLKAEIFSAKGISAESIAKYCYENYISNFVSDKTEKIGLIGLGNNGRKIAKYFMDRGYYTIGNDLDKDKSEYVDLYADIDFVLKESDVLILAIQGKGNDNLINKEKLFDLKSTCVIINISRGNIIDEESLYILLKECRIRGAILDVFKSEPLPVNHKFRKLSNTVITNHIAGNINQHKCEIINDFIEKVLK